MDPMEAMKEGEGSVLKDTGKEKAVAKVGREGVRWYLMRAGGSLERDAGEFGRGFR